MGRREKLFSLTSCPMSFESYVRVGMLGGYGVLVGEPMQLTGETCGYVLCKDNREISVQI